MTKTKGYVIKANGKKATGKHSLYKPEYAQQIIDFFSPPHFLVKNMTITKPDGPQIDKTEREALPLTFLSDFAASININRIWYAKIFENWSAEFPEFGQAMEEAKKLQQDRIRVNTHLGLYSTQAFSIFSMKNMSRGTKEPWRDETAIEHTVPENLVDKLKNMSAQELIDKADELAKAINAVKR